jgi:voltage-gated potassium channel
MLKQWNKFVLFFIILALVHLVLETTPSISSKYQTLLLLFDGLITLVFVIDLYFKLRKVLIEYSKSKSISVFFSLDLLVDFLSIIPFFISLFIQGLKFITVLRLLRMLRILKLLNVAKSHSLIINAVKNKRHELYISMQVVIIITIILSAILYFVENPSQPENFSSITDAFLWSISKFIGEIGGYGDFAPITVSGKILATFVGILGIAIFAVPAGIISSGFVEEIEQIKKSEQDQNFLEKIRLGFQIEHLVANIRAKDKINLGHIRRKFFTLSDVNYKLNIPTLSILNIAEIDKGIRVRNYNTIEGEEQTILEFYDSNSSYGTFTNRDSKISVISTHSKDQPFLGHFSYALSEYLQANYISVEKYSATDFDSHKKINFAENKAYTGEIGCNAIEDFKRDLLELSNKNQLSILVRAAGSSFDSFEVLNGKAVGEDFCSSGGTFDNKTLLSNFKNEFQKIVENNNKTVGFNKRLTNNVENNLAVYLKNKLNMDNTQIHVSANLLKEKADEYYNTIKIVGDGIRYLID